MLHCAALQAQNNKSRLMKSITLRSANPTFHLVFAVLLLMAAGTAFAQTENGAEEDSAERTQQQLTNVVQKIASGVDNFFSNDRYAWSDNKSRVTLRGNFDWVDAHGWEFNPQVRLYVNLPGLDNRLRLVINEDDDDGGGSGGGDAADDETNVALRFIGSVQDKYGITFDAGVSTRGDPTLQVFGRVNFFRNWELGWKWAGRAENRLYYYNDSKLRNDFRWYFERNFGEKFFFRSRTRFDYQEDKEKEWYPEQRFTLFHQISNRTALAYEAIYQEIFFDDSVFDEDEFLRPCGQKCTQYQLRLRFRQNVLYPWLFYEFWPIAAWTEQRDYEFTPAARFRLEIVLGEPPTTTKLGESD